MPKDWKEQRKEELEEARQKYEEARKLVESENWPRAQAAFFSEAIEVGSSWNGSRDDAFRVVSVIHYMIMKIKEPIMVIEEYERKMKNMRQMDPDTN